MKEHQHRGLTSAQVEESRRLHGDNLITPRKGDSAWKLFAEKFRDPIIQVLLVAALLSLAMAFIDGEFLETIGIICAIVLATCVGFFFELDAMRRFKRLNLVNDDIPVKVVRDGEMTEVPRRDVVVGDLVYVENGETVPADGKLAVLIVNGGDIGHLGDIQLFGDLGAHLGGVAVDGLPAAEHDIPFLHTDLADSRGDGG